MTNPKILAFIPARAGSKRLPNKNIKEFAGKPLIAWTIEAALGAKLAMDVVVSTDSLKIADIAQGYGAEVPFMRPEEMAGDSSSTFESLRDTVLKLSAMGREYDYMVFLQPTSPLRKSFHIDEAFNKLIATSAKSVVSVSEVEHPFEWSMIATENGDMTNYINDNLKFLKMRSQELPARVRLNGALFCAKLADVLAQNSFYLAEGTYAYEMEKKFAIDIDELIDFEYAEFLMLRSKKIGD